MKNQLLTSFIILLISISGFAQGGFGIFSGASYFIGHKASPMCGILIMHSAGGEGILQMGITYHAPVTIHGVGEAYEIGNSNIVPLGYKQKFTMFDFDYTTRIYFGDNSFEDGGIYPLFGFSLAYSPMTITADYYDETKYRPTFQTGKVTGLSQLGMSVGCGYDKVFENDQALSLQLFTNINIPKINSYEGEFAIPNQIALRVGYSIITY